jgi:regulatory protein
MELSQFQKAFNFSLKLLAIRKRTIRQLRRKLEDKRFDPFSIQEVLRTLQDRHFLNDEDYARSYVEDKQSRNPTGKLRMVQDLRRKGIDTTTIRKILGQMNSEDEINLALKLARDKAGSLTRLQGLIRRKKVYDFLIRKGFPFEVCRNAVNHI